MIVMFRPGACSEPRPPRAPSEKSGHQGEVCEAHEPRGEWIGEAHERSGAVRRCRQRGAGDGRYQADPDGRSYCGVRRHRSCAFRPIAVSPRCNGISYARPFRSRWLQPGQQQGRRCPSSSSSWVRRIRRCRVTSCLASSTQQMNSFRARGVISLQAWRAVGLAIRALRRSPGSLCTTPPGSRGLPIAQRGGNLTRPVRTRPHHATAHLRNTGWTALLATKRIDLGQQ